jgi:hypothetical protein
MEDIQIYIPKVRPRISFNLSMLRNKTVQEIVLGAWICPLPTWLQARAFALWPVGTLLS